MWVGNSHARCRAGENLEIISKNYLLLYFLLFHESKQYLRYCLEEIKQFLKKENLILNQKSRIYKSTNNFLFLGRDRNGRYAKYRDVKRKIKKKKYLYETGKINLMSYMTTRMCYSNLLKREIKDS